MLRRLEPAIIVGLTIRWVAVLIALSIVSGCGINNIPTFDKSVNDAWSEVQTRYKRRADLIPGLIDSIGAVSKEEPELLNNLLQSEAKVSEMNVSPETLTDQAEFGNFQLRQNALSSALTAILDALESYSELENETGFQTIKSNLADISTNIDLARRDYSQKVERYNSELEAVPGKWWRAFMYSEARPRENFSSLDEASLKNSAANSPITPAISQ